MVAAVEETVERSVVVERAVAPLVDMRNLAVVDYQDVPEARNACLRSAARDAAQLLVNSLFEIAQNTSSMVVELPPNELLQVPRAFPLKAEKPLTRWAKFAQSKGIQKRKKDRFAYSEQFQEDRPTYGYGSARNDPMNTWLVEVPSNGDPMKDWISDAKNKTKATAEKNKKQQKRNIAGGNKLQESRKAALERELKVTRGSTASLGRFDKPLDNDPVKKLPQKRQKPLSASDESQRVRALAHKVAQGQTGVSVNKRKAATLVSQKNKRK